MSQSIFLTGGSGYLGSYVCRHILADSKEHLILLIRGKNKNEAYQKLWRAWQLHMDFDEFEAYLRDRVHVYLGDISMPKLGLADIEYRRLVDQTDSILHIAASLNRRSYRSCLNVNLRGTLHVIKLAQKVHRLHGLRKFSEVSTAAVAGARQDELVLENDMIDWQGRDYDPYAQTKKFGEYMVEEILSELPTLVFRPSIVLGDSRFPETTQFDMVRAFVWLSKLPILPFDPEWRLDIVPADFVGGSIAQAHLKDKNKFSSYNLSAGSQSLSYAQILNALQITGHHKGLRFWPSLNKACDFSVKALANSPRSWGISAPFSLLHVFWPYLSFNTVFDNSRIIQELGFKPQPFSEYAGSLRRFAIDHNFTYPYVDMPRPLDLGQREVA